MMNQIQTSKTLSTFSGILLFAVVVWSPVALGKAEKSELNIQVSAVDQNGSPLSTLVAGQYARLRVVANIQKVPDKGSASISAKASFTTMVFGKKVSYSVNLPAQGFAGSTINPAIGMETSGQKLGAEFEEERIEEIFDFYVPTEAPAGKLEVTIRISSQGLDPVTRRFTFPVTR